MNEINSQKLKDDFPRMFKNIYWGFECGDGWFDMIYRACKLIHNHVEHHRHMRKDALLYNRALTRSSDENLEPLIHYYSKSYIELDQNRFRAQRDLDLNELSEVPELVLYPKVVQVKEKFGTLRFYADDTDSYTRGIISYIEHMSSSICEQCGINGCVVKNNGGWLSNLCDDCKTRIDETITD